MNGLNILALSGWTQPADALSGIVPQAEHVDYAQATSLDAIQLKRKNYDLVVGWSLGGIIARQLLTRGVINAKALTLIASPYQFVRSDTWPHGMPTDTFEQFYANYRDDTERTTTRFHGLLLKGDSKSKAIREQLAHHPQVHEVQKWLPWMDFLNHYSAAQQDYRSLPPTLLLHGKQDAIVSHEQSKQLHTILPNARLELFEQAGHAPHFHDPETTMALIETFAKEHVECYP